MTKTWNVMDQKTPKIPIITLIGDSQENFYQLGLKDKENYSEVSNHLNSLVRTPFPKVDKTVKQLAKMILKQGFSHLPEFKKRMQAYSEGLSIENDDLVFTLLIPEVVAFLSKWVPGLPASLLGCSSYFAWDNKTNTPFHGRVLDFPLQGSFDKNERMVWSKLDNGPATLSYSAVGLPYPSITAMTEFGVTFALHQKFTDVFNPKGTPIFELVFNMLQNCGDLKSTLQFLKKNESLTTWAFYMSFKNGDVLACDVMGKELHYTVDKIEPGKILYFNNMLINKDKHQDQESFLPHGIHQYNQMRLDIAQKKILKLEKEKDITELKLIKSMGTPYPQKNKKPSAWKCDTITISSVTICTLNPSLGESLFIPGPAPKFYEKEILKFSDAFGNPLQEVISGPKRKMKSQQTQKTKKILGSRYLMSAQVSFDQGLFHDAYHYLQMSIDEFEGMPEQFMAIFYFKIYQYIHELHNKIRQKLLEDFYSLLGKLPPYLNDHCYLFIYRLEKIINGKSQIKEHQIISESLKKVFRFEKKMPRLLFHKATSILMNPRRDTLDIIYAHVKAT